MNVLARLPGAPGRPYVVPPMDTIFGLPAHPLLVHIPIALLPLAAIGVLVMAARPAWHRRYRWAVLAIGLIGTLGAVLAASAGERLEERVVAVEGADAASSWERHAQLGDTARNVALVFAVVLALFVLLPWWLERRTSANRTSAQPGTSADNALAVTRNMRLDPHDRRRPRRARRRSLRHDDRPRRTHRLSIGLAGLHEQDRRRLTGVATGDTAP